MVAANFFIASSPCQPFARGGTGGGWNDPDAHLFLNGVDQAAEVDKRGELEVCIYENTSAILESRQGQPPPFDRIQKYRIERMPRWLPLAPWLVGGAFNFHPVVRCRCFLVSFPIRFRQMLN